MLNNRNLLKDSIDKHQKLDDRDFDEVLSFAKLKRYKKGRFLVHEGGVKRKTHFILKGAAIAYYTDEKGVEHVIQFAIEGWWISDFHNYITGNPALLNVRAIEDCELYEFNYEDMQLLYKKLPSIQSYFLTITQNAFASFQERILFNMSLTAEERYLKLISKYNKIELRFAQKILASYLGMSAEFYSKIRKRLLE